MKLTETQLDAVRGEVSVMLAYIIRDYNERHEVVDLILDDVVADIEETADWSDYCEDEYCLWDIQIALARVLRGAIEFKYTGE
jgi:hypothetical protein